MTGLLPFHGWLDIDLSDCLMVPGWWRGTGCTSIPGRATVSWHNRGRWLAGRETCEKVGVCEDVWSLSYSLYFIVKFGFIIPLNVRMQPLKLPCFGWHCRPLKRVVALQHICPIAEAYWASLWRSGEAKAGWTGAKRNWKSNSKHLGISSPKRSFSIKSLNAFWIVRCFRILILTPALGKPI